MLGRAQAIQQQTHSHHKAINGREKQQELSNNVQKYEKRKHESSELLLGMKNYSVKGLASQIYNTLINKLRMGDTDVLQQRWECEFQAIYTNGKKLCALCARNSVSTNIRELYFKAITRWHNMPCKAQKIFNLNNSQVLEGTWKQGFPITYMVAV